MNCTGSAHWLGDAHSKMFATSLFCFCIIPSTPYPSFFQAKPYEKNPLDISLYRKIISSNDDGMYADFSFQALVMRPMVNMHGNSYLHSG